MRGNKNWRDQAADNAPNLLFGGLIFLASLTGCASSQTNAAADQAANAPNSQAAPSPPPPSAPSPEQIAQQNSSIAAQDCRNTYPNARGSLFKLESCIFQAKEKYFFPLGSDTENSIASEYWSNLLAAAKQVDEGYMSMDEFNNYTLLCNKIMDAKANEEPMPFNPPPDQPGELNNLLNYSEEHGDYATVANVQRQIAITNLQAQQQILLNDQYEYEYCAGLHSKTLSDCGGQKITFQTDLATYQAMAAAIPQAPQSTSQSTPNNLQQQDIQDDLDAIAGGVVP
jgi:hypothetical protein